MDTKVYSLVQSQRTTAVVVTECVWGKTEHARFKKSLYNVWLDQTEWSRNTFTTTTLFCLKSKNKHNTYYHIADRHLFQLQWGPEYRIHLKSILFKVLFCLKIKINKTLYYHNFVWSENQNKQNPYYHISDRHLTQLQWGPEYGTYNYRIPLKSILFKVPILNDRNNNCSTTFWLAHVC